MDFETLFYIALIGLYLLFQVLSAKKKNKQKRPPVEVSLPPSTQPAPSGAPTGDPTLDDALREIRRALGMDAPPPPQAPAKLPSTRPAPRRPQPTRGHAPELIDAAPEASWAAEFKEREKHYADADFEEIPAFVSRREKRLPKVALPTPSRKAAPQTPIADEILTELTSVESARRAFLLGEIFGTPPGLRRR